MDLSVTRVSKKNDKKLPKKEQVPDKTITIKKHTILLTINRSDLVEVKETGDGMVFNLQGNLHMTLTDPRMPLEAKRSIAVALNTFKTTDLVVDLLNYVKPVRAIAE